MSLEITGILEKFLPIESGTSKTTSKEWKKQNFLVKTNEEYNSLYCFEVFGEEKVEALTKYQKEGDTVKVVFNVSTNEWQGKYFTSLSAWRIEKSEQTAQAPQPVKELNNEVDDLPF